LHKRVIGSAFDKTRFALGVLTADPTAWSVPLYIKQGLEWLAESVSLETEAHELGIIVEAEAGE
jgi:hypothetical protein